MYSPRVLIKRPNNRLFMNIESSLGCSRDNLSLSEAVFVFKSSVWSVIWWFRVLHITNLESPALEKWLIELLRSMSRIRAVQPDLINWAWWIQSGDFLRKMEWSALKLEMMVLSKFVNSSECEVGGCWSNWSGRVFEMYSAVSKPPWPWWSDVKTWHNLILHICTIIDTEDKSVLVFIEMSWKSVFDWTCCWLQMSDGDESLSRSDIQFWCYNFTLEIVL